MAMGIFTVVVADASDDIFNSAAPAAAVLIFWLYFAGFESSAGQATPGKRAARIVVTDATGGRISFARASLRCLGRLVVIATLGLGLMVAVFDRQRRGLDDFIAGTRVRDMEALIGTGPRPTWRKLIGPAILLVIIGGMAKVAIDVQRDFQKRGHAAELMHEVRNNLQRSYAEYYEANRRAPAIGDLPFSHPAVHFHSIEIDAAGALVLTLTEPEVGLLRLTPKIDARGTLTAWTCRAETENPQWFPSTCRP